jgi:hypothetical protein
MYHHTHDETFDMQVLYQQWPNPISFLWIQIG